MRGGVLVLVYCIRVSSKVVSLIFSFFFESGASEEASQWGETTTTDYLQMVMHTSSEHTAEVYVLGQALTLPIYLYLCMQESEQVVIFQEVIYCYYSTRYCIVCWWEFFFADREKDEESNYN